MKDMTFQIKLAAAKSTLWGARDSNVCPVPDQGQQRTGNKDERKNLNRRGKGRHSENSNAILNEQDGVFNNMANPYYKMKSLERVDALLKSAAGRTE
jgi:hypothetical protein